ncbi:glutamate racemase [Endozoicomonadaceae bacterium StTr2]
MIFDSGVGGLSIFNSIQARMPGLSVIYCSDNAGFPYGSRPEAFVIERTRNCLMKLVERFDPALAVVACNTASTVALPHVRSQLEIPVVGVVPAIKTAAQVSRNRHIGLLATPATVERAYTRQLIDDFASDCEVTLVGSSELVHLAEDHLQGKVVAPDALEQVIAPFVDNFEKDNGPDTIILGCTHFPLLSKELAAVAPQHIQWVDSGDAIARRVSSLISQPETNTEPQHKAVFTGDIPVNGLVDYLQRQGFELEGLNG